MTIDPARTGRSRAVILTALVGSLLGLSAVGALRAADAFEPYQVTFADNLFELHMIPVTGGKLTVADPAAAGAPREVTVPDLWVGKFEVTWDQYDVFLFKLDLTDQQIAQGVDATSRPSPPYGSPDHGWGRQGFPVLHVTHLAAAKFCEWLSAKTGHKYRLPSEAEFEWYARAGGPGGPLEAAKLGEAAWYWDNSNDQAHASGSKPANAFGLFDTLGNVGEWADDLAGKPVLCGGSFWHEAKDVHPSARAYQTDQWNQTDPQNPKSRWWLSDGQFVGFRVVRER